MVRSHCCSKEGLNRGAWTKMEDVILSEFIRIHGDGAWSSLPKKAGLNRGGKSCRLRWTKYLRTDIKRGNISVDEEELIIRLHRLLGNRWSLIAGRLPGRTDNEIKNYWNTHLSKKLFSMNESQPNSRTQNLKRGSKSPFPLQNHVLKTVPVKKTTAVRRSGMVKPDRCNGNGRGNCSLGHNSKLWNGQETANLFKPWSDLLKDSITQDDSLPTAFRIADANLVKSAEAGNSACSILSSLANERSPHSNYFARDTATLAEGLLELKRLSTPDCNLLSYPSDCLTDFGLEEFYKEPATFSAETNEFEEISFEESNMQSVNSFPLADHQGIEAEFYNIDPEHVADWIHEFDYVQKSSA